MCLLGSYILQSKLVTFNIGVGLFNTFMSYFFSERLPEEKVTCFRLVFSRFLDLRGNLGSVKKENYLSSHH